ncbi:SMP-30/gluconolactonase/LRE family protein [Streptomyces sp. MST-110588]|nr:SMP-30/gluconolactonase/LRE family protein [Streptomyces sp. MST-110588]UNO43686.1 SMP-30/gluconolactonase/LRE family protein [Streptomyces sp. MST-110588]
MPPLTLYPLGGRGPEHVTLDAAGRVLTGVADGRILRLDPDSGRVETVVRTGGRPLGLQPLPDGRLLVCDADRGLLRADPADGSVETVLRTAAGAPLRLCSNAVTASDGTVYVSDSSGRFGLRDWKGDLLEHSGTGRLIRYEPGGGAEVVLKGLQFANGVALAPDESCVIVAESGAYRLTRLWLTGSRAGHSDVLAGDLPGFPDNLSTGPDGLVWVALAGARDPLVDALHRSAPPLRRAAWSLAMPLLPQRLTDPRRTAWVVAVDGSGRVVHDLQRRTKDYRMVTSVCTDGRTLYLGSLTEGAVARAELPAAPTARAGP